MRFRRCYHPATQMAYLVLPILTVLAMALAAQSAGRAVMGRLRPASAFESWVFSTGLGLWALAFLTLIAGLLGALHVWTLGAILAALLVGGAWAERRSPIRWHAAPSLIAGVVPIALAVAALAVLACYPPTQWDATEYHLALAKAYLAAHRVQPMVTLRFPVTPQLNHLLMTMALALGGELAPQLGQWLLMLLAAAALFAWGRDLFSAPVGALSAGLLLGSPLVVFAGTTGYVDIGALLFSTLGFYALSNWLVRGERAWLIASAVLLGAAADCKQLGFISVGIGLAATLHRRQLGATLQFALAAFLSILPFYSYIAYYAGNPFFPLFGKWLGYGYWSPEDVYWQAQELSQWGGDHSPRALLFLLRNLSEMPARFHLEAPLSAFFGYSLPLVALSAIWRPRTRALGALVIVYGVTWFYLPQVGRYLLPALPVMSLLWCASLWWPFERAPRLALIWPIAFILLISPSFDWAWKQYRALGPPPLDAQARERFLSRQLPWYPLVKQLNLGGDHYRLHGLATENIAYYVGGEYLGDWFGAAAYSRLPHEGRTLYLYLKGLAVDYFIAKKSELAPELLHDPYFRQIGNRGGYVLFQLVYSP